MDRWSRFVVAHRWWVLLTWLVLAIAGGFGAPKAVDALSYDFGLPDQPAFTANQRILAAFGSGGDNAPVLLVVEGGSTQLDAAAAGPVLAAVDGAVPGARTASWADQPALRSADGRTGVVLVYPRLLPGPDPYAAALPALDGVAEQLSRSGPAVQVTGADALAATTGADSNGASVLAEVLFGGIGALIVLLLVFGSALALTPLLVAAGSILTTFLVLWGLTEITDVSFIVQYLLSLIGLGVAIDYALLIVTRWREERGQGADDAAAVRRSLTTAGRSVLFSGLTVAISLAALIVLPVPFLRSVGFTGLLIPVISVAASLSLLPALLLVAGSRLDWPHRRRTDPDSRLWRRIGNTVVRHPWIAAAGSTVVLLALAAPVLGLRLGEPANASLASGTAPAGIAVARLESAGFGAGLTHPVEILTTDPAAVRAAVRDIAGVAGTATPATPAGNGATVLDVWTRDDVASSAGAKAADDVRRAARAVGAQVGGTPAQDADFVKAVYGNVWWVALLIVAVTFLLLARALRSVVLPLKALLLNVVSIAAAYGITVLIWQYGVGTELLFGQASSGSITTWVPIAMFAFLFGLSMDYEVFLLARIREEHDRGLDTAAAAVSGVARTGRLVSSAALILFLAFVALSRVPSTDVKILATGLALGIIIDATLVRGVLAPALVAALGPANWWWPGERTAQPREAAPVA